MNKYQNHAMSTAKQSALNYDYLINGLTAEAGEVAGKYAKIIRDHDGVINSEREDEIAKELGDVLWFVAVLSYRLGYDLTTVAELNVIKLQSRLKRGVIEGSGDNR